MKRQKSTILVVFILTTCLVGIVFTFWMQEMQYLLPTPKPAQLKQVITGEAINLETFNFQLAENKPVLIHFFNPDCPCSRFNLKHVKELIGQYKNEFQFIAVVPAYADVESAKKKLSDLHIRVFQDNSKDDIAKTLGVYATPQAVILNAKSEIYYKGNYNKARYCTLKESSYAALAMEALLNNEPPPAFGLLASTAYGCELPSYEN